jgi:hypothetical protein
MRVRDGGGGTPGGLIRRLIDVTAAAREHLPDDCLWAYHNVGGLRGGIFDLKHQLAAWLCAMASAMMTASRSICCSPATQDPQGAVVHQDRGAHARFAVGHSREVAARHYADLPSLRPLHETAIADAFRAAVAAAMPTVLPPTAEQTLREAPGSSCAADPAG